jgi:hypothetical protein
MHAIQTDLPEQDRYLIMSTAVVLSRRRHDGVSCLGIRFTGLLCLPGLFTVR